MDRAEVEKKVAEKLGFKIRGQSGCYVLLTGRLPDKLLSDNSPIVKLWNALIDSELRRAEAEKCTLEIGNLIDRWEMMANDTKDNLRELESAFCNALDRFIAAYLNQEEEHRG